MRLLPPIWHAEASRPAATVDAVAQVACDGRRRTVFVPRPAVHLGMWAAAQPLGGVTSQLQVPLPAHFLPLRLGTAAASSSSSSSSSSISSAANEQGKEQALVRQERPARCASGTCMQAGMHARAACRCIHPPVCLAALLPPAHRPLPWPPSCRSSLKRQQRASPPAHTQQGKARQARGVGHVLLVDRLSGAAASGVRAWAARRTARTTESAASLQHAAQHGAAQRSAPPPRRRRQSRRPSWQRPQRPAHGRQAGRQADQYEERARARVRRQLRRHAAVAARFQAPLHVASLAHARVFSAVPPTPHPPCLALPPRHAPPSRRRRGTPAAPPGG